MCLLHIHYHNLSKGLSVDGLQIGTYKTKKIAELAASTAVEVFNIAPTEDSNKTLERARDAAEKATDCPSSKPRKRKLGDFLVDDDEEKKWRRGSGTRRNRTWISRNIVGGVEALRGICDELEAGRIQSNTKRVTKQGRKKVKIEYMKA